MDDTAAAEARASGSGYTTKQIDDFATTTKQLRNETAEVQMSLHELSERLKVCRARTFASEGVGRRLPLVARSALNIAAIYPAGKASLLSKDKCDDIAIQLHAFAINVYGIFDNIAWVCMLEACGNLSPLKVGLFKTECQPFIPADLRAYLADPRVTTWFAEYGKVYRDSTAHRIAPYLPSRSYTPEEVERFNNLNRRSHQALMEAAQTMVQDRVRAHELLEIHEALNREKEQVGSNSLFMALSLTGEDATPPVFLHPQLLCDWALANELVRTFDTAMRKHYGWPVPKIPSVQLH